ncbi:MAG: hypothetical protein EXS01_05185 [Phycisphaerales bacterium]|nr:hypothetical protein [Phycisphaerales bacterium]
MSDGVEGKLREELTKLERPLAHAGYLIGDVRVIDEGSWGRLDATIEGANLSGKVQIHLGKKGRISIVPQGNAARAIAAALDGKAAAVTAPNLSRPAHATQPDHATQSTQAVPRAKVTLRTSRVRGVPGELVVDCSKFGKSLIGPTEWRGVICTASGSWSETFHSPQFERGHNNLGEFLAIVDACQRIESGQERCDTLWSDSKTALSWFSKGVIRTTIDVDGVCDAHFAAAIRDAHTWLAKADRRKWMRMMSRWDVSSRGENPADFGRK